jgi:hypothetical protein
MESQEQGQDRGKGGGRLPEQVRNVMRLQPTPFILSAATWIGSSGTSIFTGCVRGRTWPRIAYGVNQRLAGVWLV